MLWTSLTILIVKNIKKHIILFHYYLQSQDQRSHIENLVMISHACFKLCSEWTGGWSMLESCQRAAFIIDQWWQGCVSCILDHGTDKGFSSSLQLPKDSSNLTWYSIVSACNIWPPSSEWQGYADLLGTGTGLESHTCELSNNEISCISFSSGPKDMFLGLFWPENLCVWWVGVQQVVVQVRALLPRGYPLLKWWRWPPILFVDLPTNYNYLCSPLYPDTRCLPFLSFLIHSSILISETPIIFFTYISYHYCWNTPSTSLPAE